MSLAGDRNPEQDKKVRQKGPSRDRASIGREGLCCVLRGKRKETASMHLSFNIFGKVHVESFVSPLTVSLQSVYDFEIGSLISGQEFVIVWLSVSALTN